MLVLPVSITLQSLLVLFQLHLEAGVGIHLRSHSANSQQSRVVSETKLVHEERDAAGGGARDTGPTIEKNKQCVSDKLTRIVVAHYLPVHKDLTALVNSRRHPFDDGVEVSANVFLRRVHNVNDLVREIFRIDRVHATHGLQHMRNTLYTQLVEVFSTLNVTDEQLGYDFADWHESILQARMKVVFYFN